MVLLLFKSHDYVVSTHIFSISGLKKR